MPVPLRKTARSLADTLAEREQLDVHWARTVLAQARHVPGVRQLVLPAPGFARKNWGVYRSRFVEPRRIAAGLRFWTENRTTLEQAQVRFGVPPEIVVGILGVETLYGQHMGNYRVIDVLATLALDFPRAHPRAAERQAFFASELGHFLALCAQNRLAPRTVYGSFAGAMGMPQFMPSSWRRHAVDFDADGRIDLQHSAADAIGSVANYLKDFGWQRDIPTHYAVEFDTARLDLETLLAPDILPTFSATSLGAKGVRLDAVAAAHHGSLALVELQNGDALPQYVAGTDNFYAITRYNWSSYYAMAVIELGQAVAALWTP